MIEGFSVSNRAMEAYKLFEETRLKGCHIYTKTCVILLDALHKAECLEQAAIVGAVLKETAKSQHASRSISNLVFPVHLNTELEVNFYVFSIYICKLFMILFCS